MITYNDINGLAWPATSGPRAGAGEPKERRGGDATPETETHALHSRTMSASLSAGMRLALTRTQIGPSATDRARNPLHGLVENRASPKPDGSGTGGTSSEEVKPRTHVIAC